MSHSSHTKAAFQLIYSIYNHCQMQEDRVQCSVNFPMMFFLLDREKSRLSQIINAWTFSRLTPDGNEGFGVKISYLDHAYSIKYYMINQVMVK